ncbi:MAG: hypothetical protein PHC34_07485 [Candidatus Gastranaerophilales bacterium]|nr:hypothetical protein [Candidatus Gastranaerophilales bacterium]
MNGKFSLNGKLFYVKRVPVIFNKLLIPIWKYVIDLHKVINMEGYLLQDNPLILYRMGIFTGEIYVEIINPKANQKENAKIKTFNKLTKCLIIFNDKVNTSNFESIINFIRCITKLPKQEKYSLLKKVITNKIYYVLFYCPLCDDDTPLTKAMFI